MEDKGSLLPAQKKWNLTVSLKIKLTKYFQSEEQATIFWELGFLCELNAFKVIQKLKINHMERPSTEDKQ